MQFIDHIGYLIKRRFPWLYIFVEYISRTVVKLMYGRRIRKTLRQAVIKGFVDGDEAEIRPIGVSDAQLVNELFDRVPSEYISYFRPHGLDQKSVYTILKRDDFLTYGLFVRDKMIAYGLLKLYFNGNAYSGRLVDPAMSGRGLGKFLAHYISWQSYLAGFRCCATINKKNEVSLRSNAAVRPFKITAELPDGYILVEYPVKPEHMKPPRLL